MAELLVFAKNNVHPDPVKDLRGSYKRGYIVVVAEDGHAWGNEETPYGKTTAERKFVLIKIPDVPAAAVQKYISERTIIDEFLLQPVTVGRRLWQVRWDDLPGAARDRLRDDGELIIRARQSYIGPHDYTWTQVKTYFRNLATGLDEVEDV